MHSLGTLDHDRRICVELVIFIFNVFIVFIVFIIFIIFIVSSTATVT